jgi:hypothetical protein
MISDYGGCEREGETRGDEETYDGISVAIFVENLRRSLDPLQGRWRHDICVGRPTDESVRRPAGGG